MTEAKVWGRGDVGASPSASTIHAGEIRCSAGGTTNTAVGVVGQLVGACTVTQIGCVIRACWRGCLANALLAGIAICTAYVTASTVPVISFEVRASIGAEVWIWTVADYLKDMSTRLPKKGWILVNKLNLPHLEVVLSIEVVVADVLVTVFVGTMRQLHAVDTASHAKPWSPTGAPAHFNALPLMSIAGD